MQRNYFRTLADMGPDIAEVLLATLANPFSGMALASRLAIEKVKNAQEAEKEYRDHLDTVEDLESKFERERRGILDTLKNLQSEIVLNVFDRKLLGIIWPEFYDEIAKAFRAKTDQELALVRAGLAQIEGKLKEYYKKEKDRTSARWSAILVAFIAIFALSALMSWAYWYPESGPSVNTILPLLNIPLPVILWSAIGSFTAILYRFNISGDIELQDPMRWLFSRPLTGIVMGTVAYLTVRIGLLSMLSADSPEFNSVEILWLVAFIGGFSDRFADSILKSLVGRFGGDSKAELMSPIPSPLPVADSYEISSPAAEKPDEPERLNDKERPDSHSDDVTPDKQAVLTSTKNNKDNKVKKTTKRKIGKTSLNEEKTQDSAKKVENDEPQGKSE